MAWEDRRGRIDHGTDEYVWEQVRDDLQKEIARGAAGDLPPGARLPSGPELVDIYGVSKETVARAIKDLRDSGLIRTLRGRGTFVSRPKGK